MRQFRGGERAKTGGNGQKRTETDRNGPKRTETDPAAFQRESPPPAPTPLPKARGQGEGGGNVIADGMIGVFGEGAVFDETEDEIP